MSFSSTQGLGTSVRTILKTSSIHRTGFISKLSLMLSGISLKSPTLSSGIRTVFIPPLLAAKSFSLRPPIYKTSPLKVITPVIATSALTGILDKTEATAVVIAAPALGPSFGVAPSGT